MRKKQTIFIQYAAKLIQWAFANGYEVTAGELYRTAEQHEWNLLHGKSKATRSKHQDRLAIDLNLFINGEYVTDSKKYKPLGDYWVSLHPDNRWGGDWNKNGISDDKWLDGNHFEMQ